MRLFGQIIIAACITITLNLFFLSKGDLTVATVEPFRFLSQLTALLGITLLALSLILTSKIRWIEMLFEGLDKVYKAHRTTSIIAFIFLLQHPMFLILHYINAIKMAAMFVIPGLNTIYSFGIISLWIMTLLIVLTLYINLPYHIWKKTHELMSVAFLLGMLHTMMITSDISRYLPLRYFVLGLCLVALATYFYHKFLSRFFGPVFHCKVISNKQMGDFHEICIKPTIKQFSFFPGQFVFVKTINHKYIPDEEHPFSISSTATDSYIRLTCKISGDYTKRLIHLKTGDEISIKGPYGSFGVRFFLQKNVVCVAGGIGITPFVSLIHSEFQRQDATRTIHLFHSVRTNEEALYHDVFARTESAYDRFSYYLWETRTNGRLTASHIRKSVPDLQKNMVFLCGPPPMMIGLRSQLLEMGIASRNIVFEDFSFV